MVLAAIAATALAACRGSEESVDQLGPPCSPLLYEGDGKPDVLVVSDLPLRGDLRASTAPLVAAITEVLRRSGFRAGEHRVGYQSCDDVVGRFPDESRCEQNARAYVANAAVLGVIGPGASNCARVALPILSRKSAGPLATISPSNTYLGLTRSGPGAEDGAGPARYYPDGVRNYVRLVAPDDAQGAAGALIAGDRGSRRVVALLSRGDIYSEGVGATFLQSARRLGLVATRVDWQRSGSYAVLAARVARLRPDAVYLAGQASYNGRRLVEDLRAALGRDVLLVAPEAWAGVAADLGPAGEGVLVTVAGVPRRLLTERGKALLGSLPGTRQAVQESYAPEAAQAAEVLLAAIARSDGTRATVVEELFRAQVRGGILGDFRFDAAGDIDPASFELYRFRSGEAVSLGIVRTPAAVVRGPS